MVVERDAAAEALERLQRAVVALLATGIYMGETGNAWLRDVDASTGFTSKVSDAVRFGTASATRLDERYRISATLESTIGKVANDVAAHAYDLDDRLNASQTARRVAEKIERTSQVILERPSVKSVVEGVNENVNAVAAWSAEAWKATWQSANERAQARREASGRAAAGAAADAELENEEYGESIPQGRSTTV